MVSKVFEPKNLDAIHVRDDHHELIHVFIFFFSILKKKPNERQEKVDLFLLMVHK